MPRLSSLGALAALAAAAACDGALPGASEDANEVSVQATTYAHPEIGRVGDCTAALVAPDAILTAASCLGDGASDTRGDYGKLVLATDETSSAVFVLDRVRIFRVDEVAVAHLATLVPPQVATPLRIAGEKPLRGDPVSAWTYGCAGNDIDGKRGVAYRYDTDVAPVGCPGAARTTADGRIFELSVAKGVADVVARHEAIASQIRSWR